MNNQEFIESKIKEFNTQKDENYRGQNPYFPNWDGIESFLSSSLQELEKRHEEQIKGIREQVNK